MNSHVFDRSGIASLDDLTSPAGRELFVAMEHEQAVFLEHETEFRSPGYQWPRDALHTWSRCWEYPYVFHVLSQRFGQPASGRQPLIADVGSGVTFFPFAVAKLGCQVVCTDMNPNYGADFAKAAEVVSQGSGEVRFRPCTAERLPFNDEECDGVYCISVIEHIADPEPTVQEIFRILKPGGLFCLTIDLDLRGGYEIGPNGYAKLHRALRSQFRLAYSERSVHPRQILTSNTGPYPMPPSPRPGGLRSRFRDVINACLGRPSEPTDGYLLAVEGTLWQKQTATTPSGQP